MGSPRQMETLVVLGETVTLSYATADGTAVADTTSDTAWDYHETTGTLVFAPGEQTRTVTVAVHPDTLVEETETFTLSVSGEGITGTLEATGTILDNDVAEPDGGGSDDDHSGHGGMSSSYVDITTFGTFHGSSSHTGHGDLAGGRTPITTEAMEAYNGLRAFLGLGPLAIDAVGTWAFANGLTNNTTAYGDDLQGVGLWYAMQAA
ncbi:MAG: Calx-beta domain-containing protein, partial [Pseudomonadota bacterium]